MNYEKGIFTINIDESKTTKVEDYTVKDLIEELKQYNPDAEILNGVNIMWSSNGENWETSMKNTKAVLINYNGDD